MRIINIGGRLGILLGNRSVDVETESGGLFSHDPGAIYERWDEFRAWEAQATLSPGFPVWMDSLQAPSPRPKQVFGVGLNYRAHALEAGLELPTSPVIFTKFPSCLTGPTGEIALPVGSIDWEVELVAVIGRQAENVTAAGGWAYVAGLSVGQDLSDRELQMRPPAPQQFSLAKSYRGFGPVGPCLVTPDELPNPDDLELGCLVNGEQVQKARTSDLIFGVAYLVAYLSGIVTLYPGDLIFTGTPSGVGMGMKPPRFLNPGDELVTYVEGIGRMKHQLVAG